jgi:hypothetical protein
MLRTFVRVAPLEISGAMAKLQSFLSDRQFPRADCDVIMLWIVSALPHSSVAQWQSIRLLTGGL